MRNRVIAAALMLVLLASVAAATSQHAVRAVANGAAREMQWGHPSRMGLPTHVQIWSADAADFWMTLYPDSVAGVILTVSASTVPWVLPLGDPWQDATSETWHVKIGITAHTGSVYAIGIRLP